MYKMSPAQYARLTHRERMLAGMSGMASAPNGVESYHSSGAREGTALHSGFREMVNATLNAPQIGTVISGGRYQVATAPDELELQLKFAPERTRGPQSNIYQRAGVARLAGLGATAGKPLSPRTYSVAKFAPMSLSTGRRGAEVTPVVPPVPRLPVQEQVPKFGPMTVGILRNGAGSGAGGANTGSGSTGADTGSSGGGSSSTDSGGGSSGGSSGSDTSSGPGPTDMGGQLDANGNPVGETSLRPGPGAGTTAAKGVLDTGGPAVPTWAIGLGLAAVAGAAWYLTRK
jgi:hypothetical protein